MTDNQPKDQSVTPENNKELSSSHGDTLTSSASSGDNQITDDEKQNHDERVTPDVNTVNKVDFTSPINDETQVITSKKESKWKIYLGVIVSIAGIFSCIFGLLALFPNQVQDFVGNLQPTPLEGTPFAEDEIGVVLADFTDLDAGAREVEQRIERQFEEADILFIRVNHSIADRDQAQLVADTYNATITIWGESADAWIEVFYEITPRQEREVWTTIDGIAVAADLENFSTYILNGMDTLYIVNFTIGQLYDFDDDYETALTFFNQAVKNIPTGREGDVEAGWLYFYRANSYYELDNYEASLESYNYAIELDPSYSAYNNRGIVKRNLEDYESAIEDYNKAIELNPDNAFAYNNRGLAKDDLEDYESAIEDYAQAIELDPDYANAYWGRANNYYDLSKLDEALTDYQKYVELVGEANASDWMLERIEELEAELGTGD